MRLRKCLVLFLLLIAAPVWGWSLVGTIGTAGGGGVAVTDDFNRADANPIGGNWTTITSNNALKVSDNTLVGSTLSTRNGAYWNANTFSNDQYSSIKITTHSTNNIGPCVRISPSAQTYYGVVATAGTPGSIKIRKNVDGTFTDLGADISNTVANGDTLKLTVVGTTLEVFLNGVSKGTRTDSDISSGSPGVFIYSTVAVGDDWTGGDM